MSEEILRRQLVAQLDGGQAYKPIEDAIRGFPAELAGCKPETILHTPWEILEHLRIAQWDILRFTIDPDHVTPPWPDQHWPKTEAPDDPDEWHRSIETFLQELREVKRLAQDPETDLFRRIPHGTGQTVLREILLVADHNAYHLGQLMLIRRALESAT
jgi:hypothetical protein